MREIKFRGRKNGKWLYGTAYIEDGKAWIVRKIGEYEWSTDEVDPETVGQYTGLKDREGREIYEGDIVENSFSQRDDFCYLVKWYDETGQWMFDPMMKGDEDAPLLGIEEFLQDWETVGMDDDTLIVLGNSWEHPHLIHKEG